MFARTCVAVGVGLRSLSRAFAVEQRVVVVTGGAKGIGLGVTNAFAAEGDAVIALDVDESAAPGLPSTATFMKIDVGSPTECEAAVDVIMAQHGRIDVLVNNAGIQPPASCVPLHELPPQYWDDILKVNLSSIFHLSRHVLPIMIKQATVEDDEGVGEPAGVGKQGPGVVINMASVQGVQSQKGVPAYAASKGAVISLTRQMAMDYGEYGIRVLAINPGTIETPLVTGLLEMGGADYKAAGRPYPLQSRCGHVDEIGHVAVFLASSKASYMTGTDVSVDGGITAAGNWAT